ncbi:DUF6572 domain-containing protein [Rhizobium sp. 2YAF20]|uniref:DUF6572 domain-containing protein n=1 Tax=Rhizobium sp. 2YAF20 TaxID=3233027 RepID=UPI003F98DE68
MPTVEREHLVHLQDKLNAYLRIIESGELKERLLESVGREVAIDSVSKFPLNEKATAFFKKLKHRFPLTASDYSTSSTIRIASSQSLEHTVCASRYPCISEIRQRCRFL